MLHLTTEKKKPHGGKKAELPEERETCQRKRRKRFSFKESGGTILLNFKKERSIVDGGKAGRGSNLERAAILIIQKGGDCLNGKARGSRGRHRKDGRKNKTRWRRRCKMKPQQTKGSIQEGNFLVKGPPETKKL